MQKDLLRVSYEINKLSDIIEERNRLVDIIGISPSDNDTNKLRSQIRKVLALFGKIIDDDGDANGLKGYVREYNSLLESIRSVDGSDEQWLNEKFKPNLKQDLKRENGNDSSLAVVPSVTDDGSDDKRTVGVASVKRVRFDDTVAYQDVPDNSDGNNKTASGSTTTTFKPYSDKEDTTTSGQPSLLDTVSNQQLFIDQQQQLMDQDTHIESLADSVHRVHGLSLDINREITEQNDEMLTDLESLIERGGRNLGRAKRRLDAFRKASRENGPCTIIVFLLIILILLLILF